MMTMGFNKNVIFLKNKRGNVVFFLSLTACLPGWYGQNCTNKCHQNCLSCNRFNGDCTFGCKPGWKGINCENGKDMLIYFFIHILNKQISPFK